MIVAGCDQGNMMEPEPDPGPDLDAQLIELLTIGGQRPLSNFALPHSSELENIPQDPANPLTPEKVELGQLLFHETALATNPVHESGRGTYSCATCHHIGAGFQAGRALALGDGGWGWGQNGEGRSVNAEYDDSEVDIQLLRTPSVLNTAYQEVMGWAGQFGVRGPNNGSESSWTAGTPFEINKLGYDGLESQAIAGLSIHRMDSIEKSIVVTNETYKALWASVFPGEDVSLETAGLAIAAYERTLVSYYAPFQKWLRGNLTAMTPAEKRGALVFFGKAACEVCHTGPALNQMDFYALGMPDANGAAQSESVVERLGRGGFIGDPEEEHKYKVPQIYNLKDSPFYGHGGTFRTIREVIEYYNDGIPAIELPAGRITNRFKPLDLTAEEIDDLVLFVTESLYDPDLDRYAPQSLPSGQCTPANDPAARTELGC